MIDVYIDVEAFSSVDLVESGVYKYVEAPDFCLLWLSFREVQFNRHKYDRVTIDITCPDLQQLNYFFDLLDNPKVRLHAHNAVFEYVTINKFFKRNIPYSRWHCTMTKALMCGLPGGLDKAAEALGLPFRKLASGTLLINYFSKPCTPTKKNGFRTRNMPWDDLDKWVDYGKYNAQDVEVEIAIDEALDYFNQSEKERRLELLNQEINDRGVMISVPLAENAVKIDTLHSEKVQAKMKAITGLENPNSLPQLKSWLASKDGRLQNVSLKAESMEELIPTITNKRILSVLDLRKQLSNSSISKYYTALACRCHDDCVRGLIQYYGAGRTGRFAGRLLQPHNLVKTEIKPLEMAREMLMRGDAETMRLCYDSVPYVLSQLIRTCLIPRPGNVFVITDFSAIEAVVLAWLAGEKWRLDLFRRRGKLYEESASRMFKIPVEQISKDSPIRAKGKISELALGYNGSVGAMIRMGALKMGIKEKELTTIVHKWRLENPRIVKYWHNIQSAFVDAMRCGRSRLGKIEFVYSKKKMQVVLPSGRSLWYHNPRMLNNRLIYDGTHPITKKWGVIDLYGGKLTENVTQAIARDLLAEAMLRSKYVIVIHVHDEIVFEVKKEHARAAAVEIDDMMKVLPDWAQDMPVNAATTISPFYRKD